MKSTSSYSDEHLVVTSTRMGGVHMFLPTLLLSAALSIFALGQAGAALTFQGQVVCGTDQWLKEDRRLVPYGDMFDRAAAASCVAKGEPPLLAVMDAQGRSSFYVLEGGVFKLPERGWLPYVGDAVQVTGAVTTQGGTRHFRVDTLRVVMPAIADSEPRWEIVVEDPELTLKDLTRVRRQLSDYRGRIVVLNFFATYCVPCRKELPQLTAIQREYADRGVQVITVSADDVEDGAKVRRFVRETRLDLPVWLGATEADMARFGLRLTLPDTVIIGRDGRVAWRVEGAFDPAELRRQIDAQSRAELIPRASSIQALDFLK